MINLRFNYPILDGEYSLFKSTLANLPYNAEYLELEPANGYLYDRQTAATWLSKPTHDIDPDAILMACGGHHALTVICLATNLSGKTVVVDPYTYNGFIGIASMLHINLISCPMDEDGMIPEQLADIIATHNVSAVYVTPTLHNPLAFTMPLTRRLQIAEVIKQHNIIIIDDDAYGFLDADAPVSFAHLAPEQGFYIYSFAKPLAPGIKLSYIVVPPQWRQQVSSAIKLTSSGPVSLMVKLVDNWISTGAVSRFIEQKRELAVSKQAVVSQVLKGSNYSTKPSGSHLWLPLPPSVNSGDFSQLLLAKGVDVVPGQAYKVGDTAMPDGIRIAFGSVNADELEEGLSIIAGELRK